MVFRLAPLTGGFGGVDLGASFATTEYEKVEREETLIQH